MQHYKNKNKFISCTKSRENNVNGSNSEVNLSTQRTVIEVYCYPLATFNSLLHSVYVGHVSDGLFTAAPAVWVQMIWPLSTLAYQSADCQTSEQIHPPPYRTNFFMRQCFGLR